MNVMANGPILETQDVSFAYGRALVLRSISFAIQPGEFVALMGPNGSGKTTLLKTLLGILRPLKGEVLIDGRPVDSYAPKQRARLIGYATQEPAFNFPLTVAELVSLGRYPHGMRLKPALQDEAAVEEALRLTESTSLGDRKFTTLSGGERQKVLIARVLAQTTHLLLMDEPTSHLDLYFQLQVLETLKRICREKMASIVAVLHDLNLVSLFADKALLLKEGEPVAFGKVAEVVNEQSIKAIFGVDVTVKSETGTNHYFFQRRTLP